MDEVSNKAIIIAVSLLVTIIITSAVFGIVNQIKEVYAKVYETDVSIKNQFGEYDMYNNSDKTGIDLINAANKYLDRYNVKVRAYNFSGIELNTSLNIDKLNSLPHNIKYYTTIFTEDTGTIVINFNRR